MADTTLSTYARAKLKSAALDARIASENMSIYKGGFTDEIDAIVAMIDELEDRIGRAANNTERMKYG